MMWLHFFAGSTPVRFLTQGFSLIPRKEDMPDLARMFETGEFTWNGILLYGLFLIKFLLLFAGATIIITVIFGGYRYILGAVVEDKEKGRDTLKHGAIGFALVVLSWAIVDIVVTLLT